ncbi:MAG: 4Fe-4S binding protein [Actinobacteria bacterium]|nr:4Fe-4S binding protein [Actinomycetota bacterium]
MFDKKYLEKLKKLNGYPSEQRLNEGAVAVIECMEEIPCNPCETACPKGSIKVGDPITNLPSFNEVCTGCGKCAVVCPGLAIFIIDKTYSDTEALITIPYELLPLPVKGAKVMGLNRQGESVCEGRVIRVSASKNFNKTALAAIAVPKKFSDDVRFFKLAV